MFGVFLTRLPSRRLCVTFSMGALLIVILVVMIYKAIVPAPPDSRNMYEWTPSQIYMALYRNEHQPSFKKVIEEKIKLYINKIQKLLLPDQTKNPYAGLIITESRIDKGPNAGYFFLELEDRDADLILKQYKTSPLIFKVDTKINQEEMIKNLRKGGYHPIEGVYDDLSFEVTKNGFSFPLENSKSGYAVFIKKEKIAQIRKIKNYEQYLAASISKMAYTAQGVHYFYIPSEAAVNVFSTLVEEEKWTPEQITYAYLSTQYPPSQESEEVRKIIAQKTIRESYLEMAEDKKDASYLHISVSREDVQKIIDEYGKLPFFFRFGDKIDEPSIFQNLEKAGYNPQVISGGFCFPLKNSSKGYAVFTEKGVIVQIRKLWNYSQFLNAPKKKKSWDYTAQGILLLYLPDVMVKLCDS